MGEYHSLTIDIKILMHTNKLFVSIFVRDVGPVCCSLQGGFYSPKSGPAQRERNHSMNGIQKQPVFSPCFFFTKFSFEIKI